MGQQNAGTETGQTENSTHRNDSIMEAGNAGALQSQGAGLIREQRDGVGAQGTEAASAKPHQTSRSGMPAAIIRLT
jgi:hypothetical protein